MSIKTDIDRGLEIVAEIETLKAELKAIKARVEKAALKGPQIPLEDAERDGMQYLAKGSGQLVPVIITADFLTASFTQGSDVHTRIAAAVPAQRDLHSFFAPKTTYERLIDDGKAFRKQAREMLGATADRFIQACVSRDKFGVPRNAVKIEWARARTLGEDVPA